jgi:diguanylate cyclase (GGDEF)-like protein
MSSEKNHKVRFSRQIFLQYFISAVVPIVVLSYFSHSSITDLLNKNANRQIYAESRSIGLTIFDRFLNIESNLRFSVKYLDNKEELKKYLWLNKLFHSIYTIKDGVVDDVLFGLEGIDVTLSGDQRWHLRDKSLIVISKDKGEFQPLMIQAIEDDKERFIVAKINPDYLWALSIKGNDSFCILIDEKDLVFCSYGKSDIEKSLLDDDGKVIDIKDKTKSEPFSLTINDGNYVSNIWDLFLQPQFGVESFLVIYFIEKKEAFLDYDFYKSIFPQTIVITLLLVYLLSSIQMRRSLVPLSKLTQGVKNIIAGDFEKRVEIDSGNEFEVLGNSFNDMSGRINQQFVKLNTLSKIDRLILSTSDPEFIVEILIEHIPTFVPSGKISILIFDKDSKFCGTLYYRNPKFFKDVDKTNLILSRQEYEELLNATEVLKIENTDRKSYLDQLKATDDETIVTCPIRSKDELLGAINISVDSKLFEEEIYADNLPELADRTAVAISNAQWEQKLFRQAHYDALTELPNRYLFKDRLVQAIERAKRNSLNVAVLFIDLDRFKSVNDSLGHAVGDKLLTEVSNILLQCVRTYDSVARFGGDEYTIIISDVPPDQIEDKSQQLADRILEMMSEPIVIDEREFYVSPSIGISIYPRDANNFDDLLKNADTAMYKAKNLSSGNYQFYQTMQNKETLARLELENDLRHAMEKEQLELYFQPKINLVDGKIYDVEALIRWKHPVKGMVAPEVFIPLAEETGLITSIGYWVMKKACIANKKWQDEGHNLNTAVNVSADQFRHLGLYEKIIYIIDETGVNPKNIELEITESITIESFEKTINLLNKLKSAGLGICIDDFGTGYSSMRYLQKIPIDKLKIDKSFIDNISFDKDAASITRAIIALAHNLELVVVAEGVESKAQYEYLAEIKCDEVQGYYISRALPESELIGFIEKHNNDVSNIN